MHAQFSFAVLYEMATVQRPFKDESDATIHDSILNRDLDPPTHLNKKIPTKLEEIIYTICRQGRLRQRTSFMLLNVRERTEHIWRVASDRR